MSKVEPEFSSVVTALGYLPMGSDSVQLSSDQKELTIKRVRHLCSCCFADGNITETVPCGDIESATVRKPTTFACRTILNFTLFGILGGFWLHSIVAGFVTAEASLGSSSKHTQLGMVWGIMWVTTGFMLTFVLRSTYVILSLKNGERKKIEVADKQTGIALIQALQLPCEITKASVESGQTVDRHIPTVPMFRKWGSVVAGTVALAMTFIYTPILFLVFVEKCSECGGCKDKGDMRPGCYYEGYPETPLAAVVVFTIVAALVVSFYGRCARLPQHN
eukprot:m.178531 g.178531  ORF g.178531 m.178531 type:complete len:277 (-) comp31945_c0_seq1:64-894(-)